MIFTRLKCTTFRVNLHLDDLGKKSYFIFNLAFKVKSFQLAHPKWPSFKNISYVLDAYGASIYIAHHLKRLLYSNGWFLNIMYLQTTTSFSCEN
jgi:hypothetical protein